MLIINTSYSKSPEFDDPQTWLRRIDFYTGILEELAINNKVVSIERINYEGEYYQNEVHYYFVRQKRKVGLFPYQKTEARRSFDKWFYLPFTNHPAQDLCWQIS